MSKDITLTVDYHDRACVIRWLDHGTGRDQVFTEVPTTKEALNADRRSGPPGGGPRGTRDLDPGEHHGLGPRPRAARRPRRVPPGQRPADAAAAQGQAAQDRQDRHGADPA